jgi:hypothetical protein
MGIHKWDLLNWIFDTEVTAWDYATDFNIPILTAKMRLLRAFNYGWLYRRKEGKAYIYSLSQKAWNFYQQYGSFNEHPYYGHQRKK